MQSSSHHIDISSSPSSSYGIPSFQQLCYTTINEYMDSNTIKFNQFYQILSDKKIINEKISNYYNKVSQACYYNTDAVAIMQKKRMSDDIITTKIDIKRSNNNSSSHYNIDNYHINDDDNNSSNDSNIHHHHHCYNEDLIYEQYRLYHMKLDELINQDIDDFQEMILNELSNIKYQRVFVMNKHNSHLQTILREISMIEEQLKKAKKLHQKNKDKFEAAGNYLTPSLSLYIYNHLLVTLMIYLSIYL